MNYNTTIIASLVQWIIPILIIAIYICICIVIDIRYYKHINNEIFVKHGLFGKWENLTERMKEKHPDEYIELSRKNK